MACARTLFHPDLNGPFSISWSEGPLAKFVLLFLGIVFLIVLSWQEKIYMIRIDGAHQLSNQYPEELEFSPSIGEEHYTGHSLN